MNKPHWLANAAFEQLLDKYNRVPRCAISGKTEADGIILSVDHIVPRHQGGTDDVSNLQFMELGFNCRKGVRADTYWSKDFWFDRQPNMDFARAAQQQSYNEILRCKRWFTQPISSISRLLYVFPWIVGAGKTLNILTASCAINAVIREAWGAARRADRILVLAKEQAIRDQLAKDLEHDSKQTKLFQTKPKVEIVEAGWRFRDGNLDQANIVVACNQQFWDMGDRELASVLHEYPLIWIDEPHWAVQQNLRILDMATSSICFGNTSTPIDHAGELLRRMVAINIFSYQDADEGDRSLKFLSTLDVGRFVRELDIEFADTLHGQIRAVVDGYEKNIEPAKAIVDAVIAEMKYRDGLQISHERMAQHRDGLGAEIGIHYPAHPMIVCDWVRFGEILCAHANLTFEKNRSAYPREKGYHAEIVHTESDEPGGKRPHKPLDADRHPWLRYKNTKVLDEKCSRLLFVSGMGREGLNNPACGPIGQASTRKSLVEKVQRGLGRQSRAITAKTEPDGKLIVPPAALDSILVITHKAFDQKTGFIEAIDWLMNMHEKLEGLPTVQSLMDGDQIDPAKKPDDEILLPSKTKIAIAAILGGGGSDVEGWPGGDDDVEIIDVFGGDNQQRKQKIKSWIDLVRTKPAKARKLLGFNKSLSSNVAVTREEFKRQPTDADLHGFLRAHHTELADCDLNVGSQRAFAMKLYLEHIKQFETTMQKTERNISQVKKGIEGRVFSRLGGYYKKDPTNKTHPFNLVGRAVQDILGTRESVAIGSRFDIPQVHALLANPEIERDIVDWVCGRLIDSGQCPSLDALRSNQDDEEPVLDEDAA